MSNEETKLYELPKGWVWASLGDVSLLGAGNPAPQGQEYFEDGDYPFVRVQDMGSLANCAYVHDTRDHLNRKAITRMRAFPKGTVLFTKSGMSTLLNQRAILVRDMYVVSHIGIALPLCGIPSEWLYFWLRTVDFKELTHATTLPSLQLSKVQEIGVPLPPLSEQHRIVAKIEELFTRLDAGIEALKKIRVQLKRYRQAVLRDAFAGKLTAEWREAHKGELEPASVLLERIKEERQKNAKGKFKELPPLDTPDLPELPEGWAWTTVGDVSEKVQYGTSEKAVGDSFGIPVIRMGNIQEGKLVFEDLKYFPKDWQLLDDFILQDGDILFNRTNSAELVGKVALYKSLHPKAIFASYLIRVRVNQKVYTPDILSFFINSFYGRQYITSVVCQQVGQANVNGTKLSLMPIPVTSLPEQRQIVEEIERHFSIADQTEKTVEHSLKQAERLRRSILKRAFEGRLVPQDPSDEPAEKLLERIKAEKAKREAEKKAPKGKKRVDTRQRSLR